MDVGKSSRGDAERQGQRPDQPSETDTRAYPVWHRSCRCKWGSSVFRRYIWPRQRPQESSCEGLPISWLAESTRVVAPRRPNGAAASRLSSSLPTPHGTYVHVHKLRIGIVAHSTSMERQ